MLGISFFRIRCSSVVSLLRLGFATTRPGWSNLPDALHSSPIRENTHPAPSLCGDRLLAESSRREQPWTTILGLPTFQVPKANRPHTIQEIAPPYVSDRNSDRPHADFRIKPAKQRIAELYLQ